MSGDIETELSTRCPYHRDLSEDFHGCPAFQPTEYITFDLRAQRTRPVWTCRYLEVGQSGSSRFYPSCALGGPVQRRAWAARVQEDRVELFRSLQVELSEVLRPHVLELLEAKARRIALHDPLHPEDDGEVGELVASAMRQVDEVLELRRPELRELNVSVSACRELIEWVLREVGKRSDQRFPVIPAGRLRGLPADVAELLGAFRG
jgi:hypothetical protein